MSRSNKHSFGGWATWQKQRVTRIAWTHTAWFLCTVSHPSPLLSCTCTSTLQKIKAMNRLRKTYLSKSRMCPGTKEAQSHRHLASHHQDTFNSLEKISAFSSYLAAQLKFWVGGGGGSRNHHLLLQNRRERRKMSRQPWAALVSCLNMSTERVKDKVCACQHWCPSAYGNMAGPEIPSVDAFNTPRFSWSQHELANEWSIGLILLSLFL